MDFTRPLQRGEEDAVDALLRAAFGGGAEADLVRKLRKSKAIAGEMVLPLDGQIAGYYALSHMVKPKDWLALAPVAITPDRQRQRLGKRMMGMLSEWARLTNTPLVVAGNPLFFEKAGFRRACDANPNVVEPVDATMLAGVEPPMKEALVYPDAFKGL